MGETLKLETMEKVSSSDKMEKLLKLGQKANQ